MNRRNCHKRPRALDPWRSHSLSLAEHFRQKRPGQSHPQPWGHVRGGDRVGVGARLSPRAETFPPPSKGALLSSAPTCLVSPPPTPSTALPNP